MKPLELIQGVLVAATLLLFSCASSPAQEDPASVGSEVDEQEGPLRRLLGNTGRLEGMPATNNFDMATILSQTPDSTTEGDVGGDFLVAPIPFLNPTIGVGIALGAAYFVPIHKDSPPSVFGGGVLYSENGTAGLTMAFKGYFNEDSLRMTAGVASTRIYYDLTVDGGQKVPLRQDVAVFGVELLARVHERFFFGPQVLISDIDTLLRSQEDDGSVPEDELRAESIAVGLRLQRDTRDSPFYPREGSNSDLQLRIFDESLGSDFDYQVVPLSYNKYMGFGERSVLAVRASGRFVSGDVPFYGESFFGSSSDLRGYTIGTIHDDIQVAAQAEYRRELFWRVGAVAFAGVGAVADKFSSLDDADALPSLGFGLRVLLEKDNHVNFRLDFAWGEDQSAVYFGVGEAF